MFSTNHFYHRIIRKNVVAFGNLFNNITMLKYSKDGTEEHGRQTVPISYSGKENFVSRLFAEPELAKATQIQLPRMSFEMTSLSYDSSRKLSKFNTVTKVNPGDVNTVSKVYGPVPYSIGFELNIYVRNVEDGTQIVEQILPFFAPDYVITLNYLDGYDIALDVPIQLDTVDYTPQYEGPDITPRILIWTLTFTMKTFFFATEDRTAKIIRKTVANTYDYDIANTQYVYQAIYPDPYTANVNSDYGFTEIIREQPTINFDFELTDSTILFADNTNLSSDDNDG
jgi:hypothetical protein